MRFIFIILLVPYILSPVEFTVPFQAYDADIADIDNDNDFDIIVGSLLDSVTILLNNGYGEFSKTVLPKYNYAYIKMVDIDCDGLLDICTKNSPDYQLAYYKNLGNLQFDEAIIIPVENTYVFQLPNFNDIESDGDMDIILNHCGEDGACNILINDGSGNFNEENAFINENGIVRFDVGDIDNDNFSDILIATHTIPILYFNDNFNFIPMEIDIIPIGTPYIFDMDNDNDNDLVFNNDLPSQTKIFFNNGSGQFDEEYIIDMPLYSIIHNINNYNNDGFPDFAVQTSSIPPELLICFNNGDGTIAEPVAYFFGSAYSFVVRSADFDGNGFNDLLVTAYYISDDTCGASILFNDGFGNFVDEPQVGISDEYKIENVKCKISNYPNPFNPITRISYELPANVKNPVLEIFNVKGEKIKSLYCQKQLPIIWDGSDKYHKQVSSGVYLYRIKADDFISCTKKMLMLK